MKKIIAFNLLLGSLFSSATLAATPIEQEATGVLNEFGNPFVSQIAPRPRPPLPPKFAGNSMIRDSYAING